MRWTSNTDNEKHGAELKRVDNLLGFVLRRIAAPITNSRITMKYAGPQTLDVGVTSRKEIEAPFHLLTEPFTKEKKPWRIEELTDTDVIGGEPRPFTGARDELMKHFLQSNMKGFNVFFAESHAFLMLWPPNAWHDQSTLWRLIAERDEVHWWEESILDELIAYPGVRYAALSVHSVIEKLGAIPLVTKANFPWDDGLLLSARVRD